MFGTCFYLQMFEKNFMIFSPRWHDSSIHSEGHLLYFFSTHVRNLENRGHNLKMDRKKGEENKRDGKINSELVTVEQDAC